MHTITPSYYHHFSCLADRCLHSCCIGWEIAVDEVSAARYRHEEGALGERLNAAMVDTEDGVVFALNDRKQCPFLNDSGLCELILARGDEMLCDICALHPRFRFDFSDRTEWGLGLSCEAAAELILTQPEPTVFNDRDLPLPDDPEEATLLRFRQRMLDTAQDRSRSLFEREEQLLKAVRLSVPNDRRILKDWFSPLERLDPAWDTVLCRLDSDRELPLTVPETAFEQLLVYFLYRQLPFALYDGEFAARTAFAVLSVRLLRTLTAAADGALATLADTARLYSSEIEYSDENLDVLLDRLNNYAAS